MNTKQSQGGGQYQENNGLKIAGMDTGTPKKKPQRCHSTVYPKKGLACNIVLPQPPTLTPPRGGEHSIHAQVLVELRAAAHHDLHQLQRLRVRHEAVFRAQRDDMEDGVWQQRPRPRSPGEAEGVANRPLERFRQKNAQIRPIESAV